MNTERKIINHIATAEDISAIIAENEAAAINGNALAQCKLGTRYFLGEDVAKSYMQAFIWYQRSALQGFPPAQFCLAEMYSLSNSYFPDRQREILDWGYFQNKLADPSFQANNAQCRYLERYHQDMAIKWYLEAAKNGIPAAKCHLASWYAINKNRVEAIKKGENYDARGGFSADYNKAFALYYEAALAEHPPALYSVGALYRLGLGKRKDVGEAVKWLRLAGQKGDYKAERELREIYYFCEASPFNSESIKEYRKIIEQNPHFSLYYKTYLLKKFNSWLPYHKPPVFIFNMGIMFGATHPNVKQAFNKLMDKNFPDFFSCLQEELDITVALSTLVPPARDKVLNTIRLYTAPVLKILSELGFPSPLIFLILNDYIGGLGICTVFPPLIDAYTCSTNGLEYARIFKRLIDDLGDLRNPQNKFLPIEEEHRLNLLGTMDSFNSLYESKEEKEFEKDFLNATSTLMGQIKESTHVLRWKEPYSPRHHKPILEFIRITIGAINAMPETFRKERLRMLPNISTVKI